MNQEKISYAEVLETSNILKDTSNKMREICDDITAQMTRLEGQWQSASAEEFKAKFNTLKAKFPAFYESVQNYAKFLDQTVETYKQADASIAGGADRLAS